MKQIRDSDDWFCLAKSAKQKVNICLRTPQGGIILNGSAAKN